jgi:uncharacterized repeat protein (TIGR04076 family)
MRDVRITVVEMQKPCSEVAVGDCFTVQGDKAQALLSGGLCLRDLVETASPQRAERVGTAESGHNSGHVTRVTCGQDNVIFEVEELPISDPGA